MLPFSSLPPNYGAYNYQKYQNAAYSGYTYEIECNARLDNGATSSISTGIFSLEACIAMCSSNNAAALFSAQSYIAGPAPCIAVGWDSSNAGGSCTIISSSSGNPSSTYEGIGSFDPYVRSARLLTAEYYPLINDQSYLLPNPYVIGGNSAPMYNLGLCTGYNNSAYAQTHINSMDYRARFGGGLALFYNECDPTKYQRPTTYLNTTLALQNMQSYGFTNYPTPASADDCLRLCDIYAQAPPFQNMIGTVSNCRGYVWSQSANAGAGQCDLFSSGYATTFSTNTTISSFGRWLANGNAAPADTAVGYRLKARETGAADNSLFGRKY